MADYFLELEPIHPGCLVNILQGGKLPKNGMVWELKNQILPLDMYCYLHAKYGAPNGLQNFLRSDDSDNLIHWEWALASEDGVVMIQGHNFRSEVHLIGDFRDKGLALDQLITQFKSDFSTHGKKMKEVRMGLEKWTQFINPYKRISSAVEQHFKKLKELNLDPATDKIPQPITEEDFANYQQQWTQVAEKYDHAIGLAFGIRSMLPVLAESFVNLLLFVLGKPEIKNNSRLFQDTVRRPIDIRVQTLHLNCNHFSRPVDYTSEPCKAFHSLMNERNDILHGNVDPNKLAFGEVFFNGKVPVFTAYESFWDKSIGISVQSTRMEALDKDYQTVESFIQYLLDCLDPRVRKEVDQIASKSQLGFNNGTNRIGILFPDHIVDFRAFAKTE
ncbi:hypothetical protein [Halopseudomonas formosensis]|uniref:ApeA N-terminal domain-containing protein n=1 Tax=Halopseudomonas formosensis TaxID=1002526 RepID=A0ABU5C188_9GAMM|nr:hypothetical protein [Halopseudomonas formosensis]MDX9688804.1 hypothetical protein [Halopseudomonas formosensis]